MVCPVLSLSTQAIRVFSNSRNRAASRSARCRLLTVAVLVALVPQKSNSDSPGGHTMPIPLVARLQNGLVTLIPRPTSIQ